MDVARIKVRTSCPSAIEEALNIQINGTLFKVKLVERVVGKEGQVSLRRNADSVEETSSSSTESYSGEEEEGDLSDNLEETADNLKEDKRIEDVTDEATLCSHSTPIQAGIEVSQYIALPMQKEMIKVKR
ncbi:hypothetical protein RYX36_008929 [Vicia faba]